MLTKDPSYLAYLSQLEKEKGLPSGLLKAQMKAESSGNPRAVSPVGAMGAFQFMPATAKQYGIDPFDPMQAAKAAAQMNSEMLNKYQGDLPSALAAYNWGQGNVDRKGLENMPAETKDYIAKISSMLPETQTSNYSRSDSMTNAALLPNEDLIDVEMPDGTIVTGVPSNITRAELEKKLGMDKPADSDLGGAIQRDVMKGALSLADVPGMGVTALMTLGERAGRGIKEAVTGEKQVNPWGDSFMGEIAQKMEANPLIPKLGRIVDATETAATRQGRADYPILSAAASGAGSGAPFGPLGALGGAVSGAVTEAATEMGANPVVSALAGIAASMAVPSRTPSALAKTAEKFGEKAVKFKPIELKSPAVSPADVPADQLGMLAAERGNVIRLPVGAKNYDVEQLRFQEEARQGILGPNQERAIRRIDEAVVGDIKATAEKLIGKTDVTDPNELLGSALDKFKRRAAAEQRVAGRLMDVRNDKIANSQLYRTYTRDTLAKQIDELTKTPDFQVGLRREENAGLLKDIQMLGKGIGKKGAADNKPVNFANLQAWRSGLNNYKPGTQAGTLASKVAKEYDNWLDNITAEAFKAGDTDTVDAIMKANKNYREYKGKYGTNAYKGQSQILENVLKKTEMEKGQMINAVFGSGLSFNNNTSQVVGRMIKAMPERARPQIAEEIRSGLLLRAYQNSFNGQALEPGKLLTNLKKIRSSEVYKNHLSGPDFNTALDGLINDMSLVQKIKGDKTITSVSGTGGALGRRLNAVSKLYTMAVPAPAQAALQPLAAALDRAAKSKNISSIRAAEKQFFDSAQSVLEGNKKIWYNPAVQGATAATLTQEGE